MKQVISFKLGKKRLWLREMVYDWLKKKAAKTTNHKTHRISGRPRSPATGKLRKDIHPEKTSDIFLINSRTNEKN